MSSLVTVLPSSCRSRFSSRMRSENGKRVRLTPVSSSDFSRKKLYFPENEGEVSVDKLLNESGCDWVDMVSSSPKRANKAQGVGGRSQDSRPQSQRPKSKMFNGGMVLAATAVRATVAEALRVGKTACHGHHFTAISGPAVKPNRPFCKTYPRLRKSPRRNHNWNANRQTTASPAPPPHTIRV